MLLPILYCELHSEVFMSRDTFDYQVAIIGTGFAGMGAAIALDRAEISDFIMLEKSNDIGGTWRDNQYPGACCDVPSQLYSFSFELNPDWSHRFSPDFRGLEDFEGKLMHSAQWDNTFDYSDKKVIVIGSAASAIQKALKSTVWNTACKSWYKDENGFIFSLWPHSTTRFIREMRKAPPEEYKFS